MVKTAATSMIPSSDAAKSKQQTPVKPARPKSGVTTSTLKKRVDEAFPSTYVEIYVEDKHQVFCTFVGRTNVERHTLNPVYGSNLNAHVKAVSAYRSFHWRFPIST